MTTTPATSRSRCWPTRRRSPSWCATAAPASSRAPTARGSTALGLGLPLIAALSDAFEVRGGPGAGTEVRMTFRYERDLDPVYDNPITGAPGPSGRWDPDADPDSAA